MIYGAQCIKATTGGPQWYSYNMMQTLIYLGTSWYFNTKSVWAKMPWEKIIKATTLSSRYNILPPVVALIHSMPNRASQKRNLFEDQSANWFS